MRNCLEIFFMNEIFHRTILTVRWCGEKFLFFFFNLQVVLADLAHAPSGPFKLYFFTCIFSGKSQRRTLAPPPYGGILDLPLCWYVTLSLLVACLSIKLKRWCLHNHKHAIMQLCLIKEITDTFLGWKANSKEPYITISYCARSIWRSEATLPHGNTIEYSHWSFFSNLIFRA